MKRSLVLTAGLIGLLVAPGVSAVAYEVVADFNPHVQVIAAGAIEIPVAVKAKEVASVTVDLEK